MSILIGVVWFVCSAALFYIYHKLFNVIYFDLASGCLKEIIVCGILGAILAVVIMAYWYISIPLGILLVVAFTKKNS